MCHQNNKYMRIFPLLLLLQFLLACNVPEKVISLAPSDSCRTMYDTLTNQTVYTAVYQMPEPQGGVEETLKFFTENFKYPEQDIFQGSFQLEFIVDAQGNITGGRIRNKSSDKLTKADKEALRVLSLMPKWKPGKCKGENVPVHTYLPLKL